MTSPLAPLDRIPADIQSAVDYERLAHHFIADPVLAYVAGGAERELTLQANLHAFERVGLRPRLLQPVSHGHLRHTLLGRDWAHPVLLAPVAYQRLVHPLGEVGVAQGAAAMDCCLVASTLASCALEDIAHHARERWFQLYCQPTRQATLALLQRAELCGFAAVMVTLDSSIKAAGPRALRAGFVMPPDVRAVNLDGLPEAGTADHAFTGSRIFQGGMAQAPVWDDLVWLRSQTALPLLVKGVTHPQDAIRLQSLGIDGLVVSNHGGRSLDGIPATLDLLPAMRAAVGDDYPLLMDGGIRRGSDIFKALALGADAVLVGRLQTYALAVAGPLGVAHMLRTLLEELELCMAQMGCATLADIRPESVWREGITC